MSVSATPSSPAPRTSTCPVLLDLPSPHLRVYPLEAVIAEKLHAMVALGMANSRMKDYYDVWMLTRAFALDPAACVARSMRPSCAGARRCQ